MAGRTLTLARNLQGLPLLQLPDGYSLRTMSVKDGTLWADIWNDADPNMKANNSLFEREFGSDEQRIQERCRLLYTSDGQAIATISGWNSAWSNDLFTTHHNEAEGQVHWLAIRQAYQGKKLAYPLVIASLHVLAAFHQRAFLITQAHRLPALGLYAKCGFQPYLMNDDDKRAWHDVCQALPDTFKLPSNLRQLVNPPH